MMSEFISAFDVSVDGSFCVFRRALGLTRHMCCVAQDSLPQNSPVALITSIQSRPFTQCYSLPDSTVIDIRIHESRATIGRNAISARSGAYEHDHFPVCNSWFARQHHPDKLLSSTNLDGLLVF